jgi:hypothetical protein
LKNEIEISVISLWVKKEIEDSKISPWLKIYLIKQLKIYSNNDSNKFKEDLNPNEIFTIRELIKEYEEMESEYHDLCRKNKIKSCVNRFDFPVVWKSLQNKTKVIGKTAQNMKIISITIEKSQIGLYMNTVINKTLLWKRVYFVGSSVLFDEDFIEDNNDLIISNFKNIIKLIFEIESDWDPKRKNTESSARWWWQRLTANWGFYKEYLYKKHYLSKTKWLKKKVGLTEKEIKKVSDRTVRNLSSFEYTLKRIKEKYKELYEGLNIAPSGYNFKKRIPVSPESLTIEQQIWLMILDLWSHKKEITNKKWYLVWIKDFLWLAVLWNPWAIKEIYKIFHHTAPDDATIDRMNRIFKKYVRK